EDLDIEDGRGAQRQRPVARGLPRVDDEEREQEAKPAAEESQSEGDAHRLDQKADVGEAEEHRDLAENLFHRQKIFALTRNAHRPISASDKLATKVMMT